jgi:hypothetical protein
MCGRCFTAIKPVVETVCVECSSIYHFNRHRSGDECNRCLRESTESRKAIEKAEAARLERKKKAEEASSKSSKGEGRGRSTLLQSEEESEQDDEPGGRYESLYSESDDPDETFDVKKYGLDEDDEFGMTEEEELEEEEEERLPDRAAYKQQQIREQLVEAREEAIFLRSE